MSLIECNVSEISSLTDTVYKVELTPQQAIEFSAGQYIMVHMGEGDQRPFSIANAAYDNGRIELHIGADENNTYAGEVLAKMKDEGVITISGGHGNAFLREADNHKIIIAGGTGFSYAYSLLQEALHQDAGAQITLYWGGRQLADLYLFDTLVALADKHDNFEFLPVVESAPDDWQGHTGWVHHAVMKDHPDMADKHVYIAGRFEMAKTARADFTAHNLNINNLFGDAYAFI